MNDLGLTLAWLAVQVTLVLVPALVLYATAARRAPDRGASVAALSLALVVVLNVAAFVPSIGRERRIGNERIVDATRPAGVATPAEPPVADGRDAPRRPASRTGPFAGWRVAWARLERGAAEPAELCRPWGAMLAALALAGTAAGLLRLALGLGAVVACRRRGKAVDDPGMTGLLDELRGAIECRAAVELREVPDLVGPATAGWRRPVILLPEDWRSWEDSDRRAVLAHELAHVVRGDYAAGLIARLAVALNSYHPLVRWMAGRLRLQQELAADAMGARHAGGREGYLVALSRLALRQDGRSPCWPARAFLPARGTLIRRIAMLRDETRMGRLDRPWTRSRRLLMSLFLLGVTAAVAMLRGPARGSEDGLPAAKAAPTGTGGSPLPLYVGDDMAGVVTFRPAAALRHTGIARLVPLLPVSEFVGFDLADIAKQLRVDTSAKGFLNLDRDDIEWVSLGLGFGRTKGPEGNPLHSIKFGNLTVRTVAPFDWLAYLRQWRLEFAEVREGGRVYYRITGPLKEFLGPNPCVFLPDDRTLVGDEEKAVRKLIGREAPPLPAFLRGPDWERASRGLLAVAIGNRDGAFAKSYDMGRPDDAEVLSLFKGVDHWTFSVDDADAMVLRAWAACTNGDASETIARSIDSLVKRGRDALDQAARDAGPGDGYERFLRMYKAFLANLHIGHAGGAVGLQVEGFGTLADLASMIEAQWKSQETGQAPAGRP